MKSVFDPLSWAFVIIVGGVMLTPSGIVPIVTNPVLRIGTGLILLVLGVTGEFINLRRQSTPS